MHGIAALFDVFRVSVNPTHCDTSGISRVGVSWVTASDSSGCQLVTLSFDNVQVCLSQVLSRQLSPFYRGSTYFSLVYIFTLVAGVSSF